MKKTSLIIGSFVVIILGVLGYMVLSAQKHIGSESLSQRSKDFMKKQKLSDSAVWRNVVLDGKESSKKNQRLELDDCYGLTVPFPIKRSTAEEGCKATLFLDPTGTITLWRRSMQISSLDEASDVMFRQRNPDRYSQEAVDFGKYHFLVFFSKQEGIERTAFLLDNNNYLSISFTKSSNEDEKEKFETLLKSLEML